MDLRHMWHSSHVNCCAKGLKKKLASWRKTTGRVSQNWMALRGFLKFNYDAILLYRVQWQRTPYLQKYAFMDNFGRNNFPPTYWFPINPSYITVIEIELCSSSALLISIYLTGYLVLNCSTEPPTHINHCQFLDTTNKQSGSRTNVCK